MDDYKNTAQYRTYENGFADGYHVAQEGLQRAWLEIGKIIASVQTRYLIVTQEQYDTIIKEKKE